MLSKKFFKVNDAEEMGKLESSNCLNLEADSVRLGCVVAVVNCPPFLEVLTIVSSIGISRGPILH